MSKKDKKKDKKTYEEYYNDVESLESQSDPEVTQEGNTPEQNGNTDQPQTQCYQKQRHTHEFLGSTKLAEIQEDPHNHRFAGVTGEAIRYGRSHYHKLETNTDFFDHYHEVINRTSLAIPVGDGKHVHLVKGETTENDGHKHCYIFATLIDRPLI